MPFWLDKFGIANQTNSVLLVGSAITMGGVAIWSMVSGRELLL